MIHKYSLVFQANTETEVFPVVWMMVSFLGCSHSSKNKVFGGYGINKPLPSRLVILDDFGVDRLRMNIISWESKGTPPMPPVGNIFFLSKHLKQIQVYNSVLTLAV